jgi:hypothetical protein
MKLHHIPIDDIVKNPWRDESLFPIDDEHINDLVLSIGAHDFYSSLKGRRRNGKVEIACGHARVKAARKAKVDTIPVFIADMTDDDMLRLMADENATQYGSNPGAVMNEVAAVTRRLIEGLSGVGTIVPTLAKCFESKLALEQARAHIRNGNAGRVLGHDKIARYLGDGDASKSRRGERAIREAIGTLKQSGRYDAMIEQELLKHPQPVSDKPPAKRKDMIKVLRPLLPPRILDERTAHIFTNDYQFKTFRDAVTSNAARRVLPVESQVPLAKEIMNDPVYKGDRKKVSAAFIKTTVQLKIEDQLKKQRDVDKEEKERYLRDNLAEKIKEEVTNGKWAVRRLLHTILEMITLIRKHPGIEKDPRLGGFSEKLNELIDPIKELGKALK